MTWLMYMSYLLPCIAYKDRTIATTTTQQQHATNSTTFEWLRMLGFKTNLIGQTTEDPEYLETIPSIFCSCSDGIEAATCGQASYKW